MGVTVPSSADAIVGFLMGMLVDRYGKVRMLVLSLLIFIVTGTGSYFLDNIYAILVLRFLLGFGLAGIVCTMTSLIGCYYTGQQRVRMLGLQSASMGVGVLILEVLGGALADMNWNAPFLVYLIGVPFLMLVLVFLREPETETPDAIQDNGAKNDVKTIASCYIAVLVGMIVIFSIPTKMPSYMEVQLGVSATMMGLFLGFHGIGNAVFSCLHRRFSTVLSSMHLIVISFLLLAVSLSLPMLVAESVPVCLFTLVVSGFAVGLIVPSVANSIVVASSPSHRGKVMGLYAVFLNLGQFAISLVSIPILGFVDGSYPEMFAVFALIAVVMAVAMLAVSVPSRNKTTA